MAGIAVGQTLIGRSNKNPYYIAARSCPDGTIIAYGSSIICKASKVAWFVAQSSTQISSTWADGYIFRCGIAAGNLCCISEWGILDTCLSNVVCGYNPTDWFVPSIGQLFNLGYSCRNYWTYYNSIYWSSTDANSSVAYGVDFSNGTNFINANKASSRCVRAFRCVTY